MRKNQQLTFSLYVNNLSVFVMKCSVSFMETKLNLQILFILIYAFKCFMKTNSATDCQIVTESYSSV
jgi:hypothetical protein